MVSFKTLPLIDFHPPGGVDPDGVAQAAFDDALIGYSCKLRDVETVVEVVVETTARLWSDPPSPGRDVLRLKFVDLEEDCEGFLGELCDDHPGLGMAAGDLVIFESWQIAGLYPRSAQ